MASDLTIEGLGEVIGLAQAFKDLAEDQLPFATAAALTKTADEADKRARARLPSRFTIRSRGLTSRGKRAAFGIVRAEKADWPSPKAVVGVRFDWLARHEEGGTQRPARSRNFAIPTRAVAAKRSKTGKLPATLKPSPLIDAGKAFVDRPDQEIERTAKLGRGVVPAQLRRLFTLRPTIKLEPRLNLRGDAAETMADFWPKTFARVLEAAIRSRRVQAGSFTSEQGRAAYLAALQRASR